MYTADQLERTLDLAVTGTPLRKIYDAIHTNAREFMNYRETDLLFARAFSLARQEGLEILADDLININDKEPDVQKARLTSDNTKWLLSKRKPLVYGDRLDINLNTTVDIGSALQAAKQRALIDVTPQVNPELSETHRPKIEQKTELEDRSSEVSKQKTPIHTSEIETSELGDSDTDIFE